MPSLAKRRLQVGVLSSIASRPLSPATSALAVSMSRWSCMMSVSLPCSRRCRDRAIDDGLRFLQDPLQVRGTAEALRIDLVDVFGARRPRREPAAFRDDLDAA